MCSFMADTVNPLDRFVAGLSLDERLALLQRIKTDIGPEKQDLLVTENIPACGSTNLKEALRNESFFLRICLFLKSLFSSTDIITVYTAHRVRILAQKTDTRYPNLIDLRNLSLKNNFYDQLIKLQQVTTFFKSGILEYEEDEGKFFILLGSLIIPDLTGRMEKEVSPYSLPSTQEVTTDLCSSLLRKMEIILSDISPQDKATLYNCVQCLGWLKQFLRLPYDKFLHKFSVGTDGKRQCTMDSALPEITQFSNILCNGKKIHPEALQALYMFEAQSRMSAGETVDIEKGSSLYFKKSIDNIGLIKKFMSNVPMRSITAIAHNSCSWEPTYKEGGEDWFIRYKAQWRKIFDHKWESWLRNQKLAKTKQNVTAFFKTADYPLIPNRPWKEPGEDLHCNKEYSLGFLYAFFTDLYPKHSDTLKILMVDGDFILHENRLEFTDTYSEMNHLTEMLTELNTKLSPKGVYGVAFSQDGSALFRTIQGQAKIQSYMHSIEAEASFIIVSFSNLCRSLLLIFDGILVERHNPKYDGIANIASLAGPDNTPIRKHLAEVSHCVSTAFELLKEVEMIELKRPSV